MTLQYLGTARLNATPRLAHIDTPEQQAPVYTNLDALIADMQADAEAIKKRTAGMRDQTQEEVSDETILDVIEQNPGCTAYEVAQAISRKPSNVRVRLKNMEQRGAVKVELSPLKNHARRYTVAANPPKPRANKRRQSPVRDKVIAFLKANPGCTANDLAAHMGCTNKIANAHISEVRKVANVRSVRSHKNGGQELARHWLEAE